MSLYDWEQAIKLRRVDTPFYSLIMAAYMKADSNNAAKLKECWPDTCKETELRYWAPGGKLEEER